MKLIHTTLLIRPDERAILLAGSGAQQARKQYAQGSSVFLLLYKFLCIMLEHLYTPYMF